MTGGRDSSDRLSSKKGQGERAREGKSASKSSTKRKKSRMTDNQMGLFEKRDPAPREPTRVLESAAETEAGEPSAEPLRETVKTWGKRAKAGKDDPSAALRLASLQREISISEFFTKNRHLLGFDNPQKALLTTVKEAVDNSLDACEDAKILPRIEIFIRDLGNNRFHVAVTDNGPGIVRQQLPKVFGKLLYGSKFHRLKQSRGQQGIGISAAGMYLQLTTGKPMIITSSVRAGKPAHQMEIKIDTRRNAPDILADREVEWTYPSPTGTRVEMEIDGLYRGGRRSVDQYVEQTALANPHAHVLYENPKGEKVEFLRLTEELPREPLEIKPHPHGVELGVLINMMKETGCRDLADALVNDFSRVSARTAEEICLAAGLSFKIRPGKLTTPQAEALHKSLAQAKVMAPPAACVVPIGEALISVGLQKGIAADFFTSVTRPPSVYRGYPFQIEAGLAWGGALPGDELCTLYRFANRVPLQYQQSDCAITKAVMDVDWKSYRVSQSRGALPAGPLVILVHIASVWVPFTSESKEAVARYPEMLREIRLALQFLGRRLSHFLSARRQALDEDRKFSYIETYIPHIGIALREILKLSEKQEQKIVETLQDTLRRSRKFD